MSGGHFNDNGYIYYQVEQFADELKHEITDEENGCMKRQTVMLLQTYVQRATELANIMRHIDYFFSGDICEDLLIKRIQNDLDKNVMLVNSACALKRLAVSLRNSDKESIVPDELDLMALRIYEHACFDIKKAY